MKEVKKLYIIPGFGESVGVKNYREVRKIAKENGFAVVPINIDWDLSKTMSDFITEADKQIPSKIEGDYILGFSFGAYISSILAKKKNAKGYIFCSLSPYFKDDLKDIPKEASEYFGKRMMKDFSKYVFPSNIKSKAWFLVGTKDWPLAVKRTEKSYQQWAGNKEICLVKNAEHDMTKKSYVKTIKQIIKRL